MTLVQTTLYTGLVSNSTSGGTIVVHQPCILRGVQICIAIASDLAGYCFASANLGGANQFGASNIQDSKIIGFLRSAKTATAGGSSPGEASIYIPQSIPLELNQEITVVTQAATITAYVELICYFYDR